MTGIANDVDEKNGDEEIGRAWNDVERSSAEEKHHARNDAAMSDVETIPVEENIRAKHDVANDAERNDREENVDVEIGPDDNRVEENGAETVRVEENRSEATDVVENGAEGMTDESALGQDSVDLKRRVNFLLYLSPPFFYLAL